MTQKLTTFQSANAHVGTSSPLSAPKRSDAQPMDRLLTIARLLFGSRCDAGQGRRVALSSAQRGPCPVWHCLSWTRRTAAGSEFHDAPLRRLWFTEKQHEIQCRLGFLYLSLNLGSYVVYPHEEADDVS